VERAHRIESTLAARALRWRRRRATLAAALGLAAAGARAAHSPAAVPHFATFSICALDPATGELGVAVTTRVPFVGRAVPWVRAGVGAVATQAWTVVEYGRQGLDLLADGLEPGAVLARLLEGDAGREQRQLGLIDARGRGAAFTGSEANAWAGSRQGDFYTVQGNLLVGPEVVDAVAESFERSAGTGMPLAERLLVALEAGQSRGGDKRWGNFQSAALRIADARDPGRGGDHVSIAIDVGEHPEPVAEMRRIYERTQRRLGWREFSEVRGPDVLELKRMLHALGFWGRELERLPDPPTADLDPTLLRTDPAALRARLDRLRELEEEFAARWSVFDATAVAAVDAYRSTRGLGHAGNPPGLVDRRLVETLRAEYQEWKKRRGAARSGSG
jgi:uncharacterized Ntn-hydrolase superfamily protein